MTGIHLPSLGGGYQEYGRQTREHMIARYRRNAQIAKEEAERILAASDDEFVVETYLGPFAQRQREEIPPEPKASAPDRQAGHDEACEADWGPEGQESPCRCAERAHQAEAPSEPVAWAIIGRITGSVREVTTDDEAAASLAEHYDVRPLYLAARPQKPGESGGSE